MLDETSRCLPTAGDDEGDAWRSFPLPCRLMELLIAATRQGQARGDDNGSFVAGVGCGWGICAVLPADYADLPCWPTGDVQGEISDARSWISTSLGEKATPSLSTKESGRRFFPLYPWTLSWSCSRWPDPLAGARRHCGGSRARLPMEFTLAARANTPLSPRALDAGGRNSRGPYSLSLGGPGGALPFPLSRHR